MNLAAYLRDSGGESQDLSTQQQRQAITTWAADHGNAITAWYEDAARPGSSTIGRQGFAAMIDHFRNGAAEAGVVVWSMSRLAREADDMAFYRSDLRRRGYKVISINDDVPEGPIGRVVEALVDYKNEQYLSDLSKEVRRGLVSLVQQYGAVPGRPPKGFKREPVRLPDRRDGQPHIVHCWIPDPDTVPLVARAFEMRAAGYTLREIKAATGLYKSVNCYQTFFSNRLYIGELRFGDLVITGYCEPLIDLATWDAVQARAHKDARPDLSHPRRAASRYLLSGLARCARCGSALVGHRGGRNYERYTCARGNNHHTCDLPNIPRIVLEQSVLQEIQAQILDPEYLARLQEATLHQPRQEDPRPAIQADLAQVRRRIANTAIAIAEAGTSRALIAALVQLETQEQELQAHLAKLPPAIEPVALSREEIAARAAHLAQLLREGTDADRRTVLRGMIDKVIVDRDGPRVLIQLHWYYPPWTVPTSALLPGIVVHTHSFSARMRGSGRYRH